MTPVSSQPVHDLHMHSTASDGSLTPTELVDKLAEHQVASFALTDHDTTAGLNEAREAARRHKLRAISGVEISVSWERKPLHLVGLNFAVDNQLLQSGLARVRELRDERAMRIARKMEKLGVDDAYSKAAAHSSNGLLTRPHFARVLIDEDLAKDPNDAFDRFLKRGGPAYAASEWVNLEEAIDWIRAAGGVAVLAHPLKYRLTASWMRRLLTAFKGFGGEALEVINGQSTPNEIQACTGWALRHNLLASTGSDYHGPANPWVQPGRLRPLPDSLEPVWQHWHKT